MPLSSSNPNRDRNFVVLVLGLCFAFSVLMVAFIAVAHEGMTDAFFRFLTLLVVTLVPSALAAWQAYKANMTASQTQHDLHNGVLKNKVKEGMAEVLNGDSSTVSYSDTTGSGPSTQDSREEESHG